MGDFVWDKGYDNVNKRKRENERGIFCIQICKKKKKKQIVEEVKKKFLYKQAYKDEKKKV